MVSNKRLIVLCFIQYILVLGYHLIYSILYCSSLQTRRVVVWSVCMLLILAFFTQVFQQKTDTVIYVILASVLITVTYIGYLLHTLAYGILIFAMSGIILGMFIRKWYILVWWVASTVFSILYVFTAKDIIVEIVPNLFLYFCYVLVYIIAGVNLYILVQGAENSLAKLKKINDSKEQENALKNIFWANISNEIRTPMNVINGMSVLLKSENLNIRAKEYTDQIENASGMLLNIVNDTMELSNIESGIAKPAESVYDIYAEAHTAIMYASENIKSSSVNMSYCVNPRVPTALYGDGDFVQKFLIKLLNNAAIFTEYGEIKLDIDIDNRNSSDTEVELVIKVSDTGKGIKDVDVERIFTGFDISNSPRTTEQESIGLSLKLCKSMVEMLGGIISVESEIDVGTTFIIRLRQEISSEYELLKTIDVKRNKASEGWIAPSSKVLVVDDTSTNLKLISGMIKLHGIEPDTAMSGKEAISKMENKKYDLIFMDYMMPEMNGVDTLKQIKARSMSKNFNNIPVVALTSRSLQRDRAKFIDLGFDEFISKPIDDRELERLLKQFLVKNED